MAIWPATLPQKPEHAGYSETPQDVLLRTQMEVGPAKTRRRATSNVELMSLIFVLTQAQVAIFITFYETDIAFGSISYTWDHPRTDVNESFRIVEVPQISAIGPLTYNLSLSLEVLP